MNRVQDAAQHILDATASKAAGDFRIFVWCHCRLLTIGHDNRFTYDHDDDDNGLTLRAKASTLEAKSSTYQGKTIGPECKGVRMPTNIFVI